MQYGNLILLYVIFFLYVIKHLLIKIIKINGRDKIKIITGAVMILE